jgi:hypothetical protein
MNEPFLNPLVPPIGGSKGVGLSLEIANHKVALGKSKKMSQEGKIIEG